MYYPMLGQFDFGSMKALRIVKLGSAAFGVRLAVGWQC